MQENLKECLSSFVVDVLLLQQTIREKSPAFQEIKKYLITAVTCCEASYLASQRATSKADFKANIAICLAEIREANYWLRVLREAQIGDIDIEDLLINESLRLKNSFERFGRAFGKRQLQTNSVAA